MDCSPPGSSIHGIPQARILQWFAISFPGDLPDSGIEPTAPALQAHSTIEPPGKPKECCTPIPSPIIPSEEWGRMNNWQKRRVCIFTGGVSQAGGLRSNRTSPSLSQLHWIPAADGGSHIAWTWESEPSAFASRSHNQKPSDLGRKHPVFEHSDLPLVNYYKWLRQLLKNEMRSTYQFMWNIQKRGNHLSHFPSPHWSQTSGECVPQMGV